MWVGAEINNGGWGWKQKELNLKEDVPFQKKGVLYNSTACYSYPLEANSSKPLLVLHLLICLLQPANVSRRSIVQIKNFYIYTYMG